MTATELRRALEAAYLATAPAATEGHVSAFDFGVAVGTVLGALPTDAFAALDEDEAKAIVKHLRAQAEAS